MKSTEENSRPVLGVKKIEFMQTSSFNFLENERMCNIVQRGGTHNYQADECDNAIRDGKHTNIKDITKSDDVIGTKTTTLSRTQTENMPAQTIVTSEARKEPGRYAPKRYVTTCYFQPKQNPVSYSETVILTLGSSKKHYFETVMYQTKLIPFRWTESMTTLTPAAEGEAFQAHHEVFVPEPKYHYMSLEPQQIAAVEKLGASEEIAV